MSPPAVCQSFLCASAGGIRYGNRSLAYWVGDSSVLRTQVLIGLVAMTDRAFAQHPQITPDEYLALERAADFKSEYFDGRIYQMAGASPEHSAIVFNLYTEVGVSLRGKPCRGLSNDTKVRSGELITSGKKGLFSYPDLTVICDEPLFHDEHRDVLINPKVIFEVLSPSTEVFDRTKKFFRYQTIETFTDYILIAQDEPRIEHLIRQPDGGWTLYVYTGLENSFQIASINSALSLSGVYDGISFPEAERPSQRP